MLFNVDFPDKKNADKFKAILKELRNLTGTKSWRLLLTMASEYLVKVRKDKY